MTLLNSLSLWSMTGANNHQNLNQFMAIHIKILLSFWNNHKLRNRQPVYLFVRIRNMFSKTKASSISHNMTERIHWVFRNNSVEYPIVLIVVVVVVVVIDTQNWIECHLNNVRVWNNFGENRFCRSTEEEFNRPSYCRSTKNSIDRRKKLKNLSARFQQQRRKEKK